ncbi:MULTISPECIES: hypothetical protein [Bacillaceae]|uniref:Uncharacterized protein n=1 Tax=Evansella alkalicola TaxID=745819 RepID=A0ABS6JS34_9BACI|nr:MULTISPECIES: hypothetical protein [Bacillaceae]MBU9719985.1 hypothetical protein [Bacillus alkalicola]
MQQKTILIILSLFFILVGCNQEDEPSVIEGFSLGAFSFLNTMTIFVEDSHVGNDMEKLYSLDRGTRMDTTDYTVEAYNLMLENDTKIIIEDTGQELEFSALFDEEISIHDSMPLRLLLWSDIIPISVTVKEDFTKQVSTDRPGYITYSRELLPIYTAEEIKIPRLSQEHFHLHFTARHYEYNVIIVYSDEVMTEEEMWRLYDEYWMEIDEVSNMTYNTTLDLIERDFLDLYNVHSLDANIEYPYFFLFDQEGMLLETTDWDEVISIVEVNQD